MRLFIAVLLNDGEKIALQKLQEEIKSQAQNGSYTRLENFHLTLAFLGETPENRVAVLHRIIHNITITPFKVKFNCTGCFKHSGKELWWAGADSADPNLPQLKSLHRQLINQLKEEGFPVDKRPFHAHITLGREISHYRPIVLDNQEIKVAVNRLSLMKSERIGSVLRYTEICGENNGYADAENSPR